MSRIPHALSRAVLPLVAAAFTVGLASAPAVAGVGGTPATVEQQPVVPAASVLSFPPPPPGWIRREDCTRGGGHWIHDGHDVHLWHCIGGRWDRHDGRW